VPLSYGLRCETIDATEEYGKPQLAAIGVVVNRVMDTRDQSSRKVPLAEAVAISRRVTSTWTQAVDPDGTQRDPCPGRRPPPEVHAVALHGAVHGRPRRAPSKDQGPWLEMPAHPWVKH